MSWRRCRPFSTPCTRMLALTRHVPLRALIPPFGSAISSYLRQAQGVHAALLREAVGMKGKWPVTAATLAILGAVIAAVSVVAVVAVACVYSKRRGYWPYSNKPAYRFESVPTFDEL